MLPLLAKKLLDAIMSESQDAQIRLGVVPSSTTEFVNSLTFLDEIQERVPDFSHLLPLCCAPFPPTAPAPLASSRPAFSCVSITKLWYPVLF